jgi:hypothetical protein
LAVTLDGVGLSATSAALVQAATARLLDALTLVASGAVVVAGAAAVTFAGVGLSASGTVESPAPPPDPIETTTWPSPPRTVHFGTRECHTAFAASAWPEKYTPTNPSGTAFVSPAR